MCDKENYIAQTYLWDGNIVGMLDKTTNNRTNHDNSNSQTPNYYLQDELGSPIRLTNLEGSLEESYGYDEFGQDLYHNQGNYQPFGFIGYQKEGIADTYFAQAREYNPKAGRFNGEDTIKGFIEYPITFNNCRSG